MKKLWLVVPVVALAAACGGVEETTDAQRLGGGVGPGAGGGDDGGHCSGLLRGAHCTGGPPGGEGNTVEPGEFLDPEEPHLNEGGLVESPDGGLTMPAEPAVPDQSFLWVAHPYNHPVSGGMVTKVATIGVPAIAARYPSALPLCQRNSFQFGFTARSESAGGLQVIRNWRYRVADPLTGTLGPWINVDPGTRQGLAKLSLNSRSGLPSVAGSDLRLTSAFGQETAVWWRDAHLEANYGFEIEFDYVGSGADGFAFNVSNDGVSARAFDNQGHRGYGRDLAIGFGTRDGDGAGAETASFVRIDWSNAAGIDWDGAGPLPALPTGNGPPVSTLPAINLGNGAAHQVRIIYAPTYNADPRLLTGPVQVAIDGLLVAQRNFVTLTGLVANNCSAGAGNEASRTAMDSRQDAFVANRAFGGQASVTKYGGLATASHCNRSNTIIDDGVVQTSTGAALYGGTGYSDECVLWTVPVAGPTAQTGVNGVARALAVSASDADSPGGSAWAGLWYNPHNTGYGMAVQLDGDDGTELNWYRLDLRPYGAAVGADGRVWYTGGAGEPALQAIDAPAAERARLTGAAFPMGCVGQECVSPKFVFPASGSANLTIKRAGYCKSAFYGISIDEYDNVWSAGWGCDAFYRFTPPGVKIPGTGAVPMDPDCLSAATRPTAACTWTVAGVGGHWSYYAAPTGNVGVFVSKASAENGPAQAYAGRGTVSRIDAITMNPATATEFTGNITGHGGLGMDFQRYLWRVGGNDVQRFFPDDAAAPASGGPLAVATSAANQRFQLALGYGTYTYSDFTGYTQANIASKSLPYFRIFSSPCGDNARMTWTNLRWRADVPDTTALAFSAAATDNPAALADPALVAALLRGPYWQTPNVLPANVPPATPTNRNDSVVYLPDDGVTSAELLVVKVDFFQQDSAGQAPTLYELVAEGVCEGEVVTPPVAVTCADVGANCGQVSNGTRAAGRALLNCGACGPGTTCGGSGVNATANNVCGP